MQSPPWNDATKPHKKSSQGHWCLSGQHAGITSSKRKLGGNTVRGYHHAHMKHTYSMPLWTAEFNKSRGSVRACRKHTAALCSESTTTAVCCSEVLHKRLTHHGGLGRGGNANVRHERRRHKSRSARGARNSHNSGLHIASSVVYCVASN